MRLWHKDLIQVLPRQQLLSQWRECCCLVANIAINGTPNHILVNKVLDYPLEKDFYMYCIKVMLEMEKRGYKVSKQAYYNWHDNMLIATNRKPWEFDGQYVIFKDWHTDRYLRQCYYNLEEKYDCGGIPENEFYKLRRFVIDKQLIM